MSGLKTIRRRITSVRNTRQITRAMKLVSAAKLRRAQDAATGGRAFGDELQALLQTVMRAVKERATDGFTHPLLEPRSSVKKRWVLMVSGERGLCGAYNANVLKAIQTQEQPTPGADAKVSIYPMGKTARSAVKRLGWRGLHLVPGSVDEERWLLGEDANKWPADEIAAWLINAYIAGECDEVVIYYTKFQSAMTQVVTRDVLLPVSTGVDVTTTDTKGSKPDLTVFDPTPEALLAQLFSFLIATRIRQAGLESKASEHAARMTAMDSATRNADDLIDKLKLFYNRARQSAITRELIDIVGGAEAVK